MLASSGPLPAPLARLRLTRVRPLAGAVVVGIAAYGAIAPVLAVAHELIVLGASHLIGDLARLTVSSGLLRVLPLDPIYTSAVLMTLGGIEPRGLALAGPAGARMKRASSILGLPLSVHRQRRAPGHSRHGL
jgi:hypothetical protein